MFLINKANGLLLLFVAIVVSSCSDKIKTTAPARNLAINKSNSYSTLFMDSLTMESFIKEQKLNDSISRDMRLFYNSRNFQFAWFSGDGLTEQSYTFRSLYDYSERNDKKKVLDYKLDNLMLNDSLRALRANRNITKTELLFTWRFIRFLWSNYPNDNLRHSLLAKFVPSQKHEIMERADAILHDDAKASNAAYNSLKKELQKYV